MIIEVNISCQLVMSFSNKIKHNMCFTVDTTTTTEVPTTPDTQTTTEGDVLIKIELCLFRKFTSAQIPHL